MKRILLLSLLLAACGDPMSAVGGNAEGGVVEYYRLDRDSFSLAQRHCSQYGRQAKVTAMGDFLSGGFAFTCVKP